MTIPVGPAEFDNFNGGFTDFYLNGPKTQYRVADNLLIYKFGEIGKLKTRPGSELYDEDAPQIPAGAQRIGTLRWFEGTLLSHSARDFYYIDVTFQTLVGPTSNKVFPTGVTVTNVTSLAEWNHHLFVCSDAYTKPQKIYKDGSGVLKLRTAGMPDLASNPAIALAAGASNLTYTYRFYHKYTYVVGARTFVDLGPTTEVQVTDATATAIGVGNAAAITSIPVLANTTVDNYDTTAVKIVVTRTIAGGVDFFYVGEVTNGTTTFNDEVPDATLLNNEPIYTEGGVVDNDPPPLCKLVHVTEDVGFYADIKEGSEVYANRLRQSIPGDIDSSPGDFYCEVESDIVGLSSVKGQPILACTRGVFRVDGRFDELGRGGLIPQRISDTASCVSSQSVVQTLEGVFWWGEDAIYFTDGFQVIKVNEHWPETHKTYVLTAEQRRRIQGTYDSASRRIHWTVQEVTESDTIIVLDLNWGISTQTPATRLGNGSPSFAPTAITFLSGDLYRGDTRGYLFKHDVDIATDPLVDTTIAVANWGTETIVYNFESCAFNFGSNYERKFIPRISVQCRNESNLSLQITSNNDDGKRIADLAPIRFRGNLLWGDPDAIWGDATIVWNLSGLIEEWARFPASSLRCSYKSVSFTNATVVLLTSELLDTATVDSGVKTATLDDAVTYDWPEDLLGYVIAFEADWDREYAVEDRAADVLTFTDSGGNAVDATSSAWELRGKPKAEIFHLISFTLHFSEFGKTQEHFQSSKTGSIRS